MKITIIPNQIKAVTNCIPEIYAFVTTMREAFIELNPLLEEIIVNASLVVSYTEPEFLLNGNVLAINIGVGLQVNASEICEMIGGCLLETAC